MSEPTGNGTSVPEYLTPEEVARILRVSSKTIYRWSSSDPSMPSLTIGGVVRFPRARLLRWLEQREQGPGRLGRRRTRARRMPNPLQVGAQVLAAAGNGAAGQGDQPRFVPRHVPSNGQEGARMPQAGSDAPQAQSRRRKVRGVRRSKPPGAAFEPGAGSAPAGAPDRPAGAQGGVVVGHEEGHTARAKEGA